MMELPLRDIHLPDPISWWPLALGWWLILGCVLFSLCALVFFIRKYMKPTLKKEAIQVLDHIEKTFQENRDAKKCVCSLSTLLRRVSLKLDPSENAGLIGEAWLQVLDRRVKEPAFSRGVGRILLHAPYQSHVDIHDETSELINLCRKWINSL